MSLSPVHFVGRGELLKKLESYEQKKKKKAGIADCSKANQTFCLDYAPHQHARIGSIRAIFEQSRYDCLHVDVRSEH